MAALPLVVPTLDSRYPRRVESLSRFSFLIFVSPFPCFHMSSVAFYTTCHPSYLCFPPLLPSTALNPTRFSFALVCCLLSCCAALSIKLAPCFAPPKSLLVSSSNFSACHSSRTACRQLLPSCNFHSPSSTRCLVASRITSRWVKFCLEGGAERERE